MGRPPPADEVVLRCWELHTQNYSLRQIAAKIGEEFGHQPAHSTVREHIEKAREMVRYVDHMDTAREYLKAGESLKWWEAQLREEMDQEGGRVRDYLPLFLKLHDRFATMLGFGITPEMFAGLTSPPLDPKTVEMVKEVRDRVRPDE